MRTVTSRVIGFVLVALAFAEGRPIGAAEINVVASIKPVHSLVAGVMEGVAEPVLLIKGTGSEHSYSLRPSQARALDQADVVFWVGETMETFLLKPLQAFSGDAKVIELWQIPGLALLPTREGGMWEAHDHGNERADADPDHDQGEHVEENEDEGEHVDADHEAAEATRMARPTCTSGSIPPTPRCSWPRSRRRSATPIQRTPQPIKSMPRALGQRLDELDRSLESRLATVADRPYVVFHDAYQYFEHRYGVNAVGAITINPTVRPSAQRLEEIQGRLEELDAACVFAEPQFEPTLVDTVIEGTNARKGVLDPLGAELDAGPDQYFLLMTQPGRCAHRLSRRREARLSPARAASPGISADRPEDERTGRSSSSARSGAPTGPPRPRRPEGPRRRPPPTSGSNGPRRIPPAATSWPTTPRGCMDSDAAGTDQVA